MPKRVVKEQVVRRGEDDGTSDREFWREQGHEARFAASWQMVVDAELAKGRKLSDLRMRKDVHRLIRRSQYREKT
jgi:hypothetical protein